MLIVFVWGFVFFCVEGGVLFLPWSESLSVFLLLFKFS